MRPLRERLRTASTGTLEGMLRGLAPFPLCFLREFRTAIRDEILARRLAQLVAETGGFPCATAAGVQ